MRKHTPGPWFWATSCSYRRLTSEATGKDGDVLYPCVDRSDGHPNVEFPNGGFTGPDARLIAAAPDLLEALRWFIDCREHAAAIDDALPDASALAWKSVTERMNVAEQKARAAIAKAEGQS